MSRFMQRMGFRRKPPTEQAREDLSREIGEAEREGRRLGAISAEEHRSRMSHFFAELRAQVTGGRLKP